MPGCALTLKIYLYQKKSVTINRVKPILTIAFQEYRTFTERTPLLLVTALPQTYRVARTPASGTIWHNPHQSQNTSEIQPDYEVNELSAIEDLLEKI